jgi:hypothetical protein
VGDDELFLTTSAWTTRGVVDSVGPDRVIYLLQEDERMFYPHGDEQLRSSETLGDERLTFVVNTAMLRDHLVASGIGSVAQRGVVFEPAFPRAIFHPPEAPASGPERLRFLYYARPNNARNLFCRGLEAIDAALAERVLHPDEWELCFVGKEIPPVRLYGGLSPRLYENLSWQSYAALVRRMDLGLCLMYTPHPSYPPLDLAASGAVVVTNTFAGKPDLRRYSENILCAAPTVEALVTAISEGAALARDRERRRAQFARNQIEREWRESFRPALAFLEQRFGG